CLAARSASGRCPGWSPASRSSSWAGSSCGTRSWYSSASSTGWPPDNFHAWRYAFMRTIRAALLAAAVLLGGCAVYPTAPARVVYPTYTPAASWFISPFGWGDPYYYHSFWGHHHDTVTVNHYHPAGGFHPASPHTSMPGVGLRHGR